MLVYYKGVDAMDVIKNKYVERFGDDDFSKASLKLISNKDDFLIIRCSLTSYTHVLDTFSALNGMFVPLNTSGTLKALRCRMKENKSKFMGRDINAED